MDVLHPVGTVGKLNEKRQQLRCGAHHADCHCRGASKNAENPGLWIEIHARKSKQHTTSRREACLELRFWVSRELKNHGGHGCNHKRKRRRANQVFIKCKDKYWLPKG